MTIPELIEELRKLPPDARISINVDQPPTAYQPTRIQINIEATVQVRIVPRLQEPKP
jgi:hypothetical protein